jgi:hypothetical protein
MELRQEEEAVRIEFTWYERLLAVRLDGDLVLPYRHIRSASTGAPQPSAFEWRIPGTALPGVIKAGTFYSKRGREFWYVTRKYRDSLLVVELQDERYARVVLGMVDARNWAERLQSLKR